MCEALDQHSGSVQTVNEEPLLDFSIVDEVGPCAYFIYGLEFLGVEPVSPFGAQQRAHIYMYATGQRAIDWSGRAPIDPACGTCRAQSPLEVTS